MRAGARLAAKMHSYERHINAAMAGPSRVKIITATGTSRHRPVPDAAPADAGAGSRFHFWEDRPRPSRQWLGSAAADGWPRRQRAQAGLSPAVSEQSAPRADPVQEPVSDASADA